MLFFNLYEPVHENVARAQWCFMLLRPCLSALVVSIRKIGFPVLLSLLLVLFCAGAVSAIEPCEFGDDVPTSRPIPPGGGPTQFHVSLFIFDLVKIVTVKQEFIVDFFIKGKWKDQRLGELMRQAGKHVCETHPDSVWIPGLIILNKRSGIIELPRALRVYANGTVTTERRGTATFGTQFDLTDFPLDSQILPITWISMKYGPDELKVVFENEGIAESLSESEWSVELVTPRSDVYQMGLMQDVNADELKRLALFGYELVVKRRTTYYVWKVFLPLCMIVFVSWAVFWIDPSQLGVQTGIGTAMMLTIIAFLFSLQSVLPKINYLTRMDYFVYSSLGFVFLSFVEGLLTCSLAAGGRETLARRFDQWARWIVPLAFVSVTVWFWRI